MKNIIKNFSVFENLSINIEEVPVDKYNLWFSF